MNGCVTNGCMMAERTALRGLWLLVAVSIPLPALADDSPAVRPLRRAHAHNDYYHPRPLLDALDHGFCSVEADVFLVDGELRVGHDQSELTSQRTLERLYLRPLRERVRVNGGSVHGDGKPIMLLVDIKKDGPAAYEALGRLLNEYRDIVSGVEDGRFRTRAVDVVISGDRPKELIASDRDRRAGIDGRLSDLDSKMPADLMPLISDRWSSHFGWRGEGDIPPEERKKLRSIVRRAHQSGRRVRFWATPESESLWRELIAAGVDHINTDQLDRLQAFLHASQR